MKFCCGREKKEPFFPKSRLPQRSFCVMLRNVLHLLETDGSISVQAKTELFISIIIACVTEAPMVSGAYPKKEEGRNE